MDPSGFVVGYHVYHSNFLVKSKVGPGQHLVGRYVVSVEPVVYRL